MNWKPVPAVIGALIVGACNGVPMAPDAPQQAGADLLTYEVTLDRTDVEPGETFTVTYTLRNGGPEALELTSACNVLARAVVYRSGEPVEFLGSSSGCRTALSGHTVPAGGSLEQRWTVTAEVLVEAYPDGRPPLTRDPEPGEYLVRVEPDVIMIDDIQATLPPLSGTLRVR